MKKLPFCPQCKYYIKKGVCALVDKPYEHIGGEHWCIKGEFKEAAKLDRLKNRLNERSEK